MAADVPAERFHVWFAQHDGWTDPGCVLQHVPGMGRGLVATRAFAENERVFAVPRPILLNVGTSGLEAACLAAEQVHAPQRVSWSAVLERGWCPLILMMLWEHWRASHGAEPAWGPYFGRRAH